MPLAPLWAASQLQLANPPGPLLPGGEPPYEPAFPSVELGISILAYLGADPTASFLDWPEPVDLSSRLLDEPLRIVRGRQPGQKTLSSASCSFVLDNTDGELTPLLPTSTYYPDWDFGCPIKVSVDGVGTSPPYTRFTGYIVDLDEVVIPTVGGTFVSAIRVELGAVVRRLTQGAVARSPLNRDIFYDADTVAYWPMEDETEATVFGSAIDGVPAMSVTDADFAAESTLAGSRSLPELTATSALSFTVPSAPSPWGLGWLMKLTGAPASRTTLMQANIEGGAVDRVLVEVDATTVYLTGYLGATSVVSNSTGTEVFTNLTSGDWVGLYLGPSGSGVSIGVCSIDGTGGGNGLATSAVDLGALVGGIVPASSTLAGVAMGHLEADAGASSASRFFDPGNAFAGDVVDDRVFFVLTDEGITNSVGTGGRALGPQPDATAMEIMRDAETVDHGMLTETRAAWAISYITSDERYNIDPSMTINLSTYRTTEGTSRDVVRPPRNDRRIRNEWTISRPSGSASTVKDADHQAKRGRYNDSAEVNVYTDDDTRHEAGWRVAVDSFDGIRFATIPIDLGANTDGVSPDLLANWLNLNLGSRIDRVSQPTDMMPPDATTLTLEGYTEVLRRRSWTAVAVVEPYQPWEVRVWAEESPSADLGEHMGRWATERHAAIRAAINSTDTSVAIDPPIGRWTTTASEVGEADYRPLYARLGGETVKVTAVATTACTVVAAGSADHDDNAAVTPADYAGGAANDWAFVVARTRGSATLAITDANYTYTQLRRQGGLYLWATVRGASTPAPTVTPTGGSAGDTISAVAFGFANMPITLDDLTDAVIVATSKNNVSDQDMDFSGLRAGSLPGRLILMVAGKNDDWTGVAPAFGFTELIDVSSTTGNDQGIWVGYRIDTTPTAVAGSKLAVTGGAAAVSESMVLALGSGFQTLTVTRSQNGVVKSHAAGDLIETVDPLIWAL